MPGGIPLGAISREAISDFFSFTASTPGAPAGPR